MHQNDNDNTASIAIQFLVPPSKKLINMSNEQLYIYSCLQIHLAVFKYDFLQGLCTDTSVKFQKSMMAKKIGECIK